MQSFISRTIAMLAILGLSSIAFADSYVEVFTCELEDEKTIEDVQAANSKWLAYVHENVSEDIASSVITPVVGDLDSFVFVDTYPDLDTWAKTKTRLQDGDTEELFEGVSDCSESSLHRVQPTE